VIVISIVAGNNLQVRATDAALQKAAEQISAVHGGGTEQSRVVPGILEHAPDELSSVLDRLPQSVGNYLQV
jgi:hypothetical protein